MATIKRWYTIHKWHVERIHKQGMPRAVDLHLYSRILVISPENFSVLGKVIKIIAEFHKRNTKIFPEPHVLEYNSHRSSSHSCLYGHNPIILLSKITYAKITKKVCTADTLFTGSGGRIFGPAHCATERGGVVPV